ncbi:MAG: methionine adenosyltransferase [Candidatus Nanohaloarchaeota archaeon QJJ-5]|nr:methionine adenosyltransferase [Candidatus Nanohaloarchaeota archaeon QJJ-5]
MSDFIQITEQDTRPVQHQETELVERKGIGHPDTIADGISEAVSRALCEMYRDELGYIAHHNTDEVQIIGGESSPAFGGGTLKHPIYILLGGRATEEIEGASFNIHGTALQAARNYLDSTLPHLDVETEVIMDSRMGQGSTDLTELYKRRHEKTPLANDTSFGIGHAPLSETEKLVLQLENYLNSEKRNESHPWIGQDIKVMAKRIQDTIVLTVAAAFVDRHLDGVEDYRAKKESLKETVHSYAREHTDKELQIHINTADDIDDGSVYTTVTGTSAEMGDDGSTGRGNRVSGLITPQRSMSLEASSGKNPVAHVGKIYNILSHYIADQIVEEDPSIDEATVRILSQIGQPIDEPQILTVELDSFDNERKIKEIAEYWLQNIPELMDKVIDGEITTY